jgi:hypothetical protein
MFIVGNMQPLLVLIISTEFDVPIHISAAA